MVDDTQAVLVCNDQVQQPPEPAIVRSAKDNQLPQHAAFASSQTQESDVAALCHGPLDEAGNSGGLAQITPDLFSSFVRGLEEGLKIVEAQKRKAEVHEDFGQ